MTVNYTCRQELSVTSLKEFFEIVIASVVNEQDFHSVLLHDKYNKIGLTLKFEPKNFEVSLYLFVGCLKDENPRMLDITRHDSDDDDGLDDLNNNANNAI